MEKVDNMIFNCLYDLYKLQCACVKYIDSSSPYVLEIQLIYKFIDLPNIIILYCCD